MPKTKRNEFCDHEVAEAYKKAGSLHGVASLLNISYPTAVEWAKQAGVKVKRPGYSQPSFSLSGLQCRHAREYLKMTRDDFCASSGVSKTALRQFELGKSTLRDESYRKIMKLFEINNVEFKEDGTFNCHPLSSR